MNLAARSPAPPDATAPADFDAFYEEVAPSLVAVATALTGERALAEELAQEAMLVVLRRWERLAAYDDPAGFARRVVANKAVSSIRRRVAEVRALNQVRGRRREPPTAPEPADEALWAAVRALPARQAQAVALRYVCDLDTPAIASTLGCAEPTVRVLLHRARRALAERLGYAEEGADDDVR